MPPGTGLALLVAFSAVALMLTSLTLYVTEKKIVHHLQIAGFIVSASTVFWLQGSLVGKNSPASSRLALMRP